MSDNNNNNPGTSREGGSGMDRRDIIKGLAALPILGLFGLSAWGKSSRDKKQKIISFQS